VIGPDESVREHWERVWTNGTIFSRGRVVTLTALVIVLLWALLDVVIKTLVWIALVILQVAA
jgi:hypothetical protein